jgi:hypothetical protein
MYRGAEKSFANGRLQLFLKILACYGMPEPKEIIRGKLIIRISLMEWILMIPSQKQSGNSGNQDSRGE